jgi:hypothetical protein
VYKLGTPLPCAPLGHSQLNSETAVEKSETAVENLKIEKISYLIADKR